LEKEKDRESSRGKSEKKGQKVDMHRRTNLPFSRIVIVRKADDDVAKAEIYGKSRTS